MQEIEVKLAFFPGSADTVFSKLTNHLGPALNTRELVNRYYDTPALTLREQKWSLRIREAGDFIEQTVKGKGSVVGGMHRRIEKNWPLNQPVLDSGKLAEIPELAGLAVDQLEEAFQTRFIRTMWMRDQQDAQIEVVLDRGIIEASQGRCPITEIELELKRGTEADLLTLATELVNLVPCWLLSASKAQRGYHLFIHQRPFQPLADIAAISNLTQWVDYFGNWVSSVFQALPDEANKHNADAAARYANLLALLAQLAGGQEESLKLHQLVQAAQTDLDEHRPTSHQQFTDYLMQSTFPGRLGVASIDYAFDN